MSSTFPSYPGNYNPHTGEIAPGNPSTYLKNYYKKTGKAYSYSYSKVRSDNINQLANPTSTRSLQDSQASTGPNLNFNRRSGDQIPIEQVLTCLTLAELFYKLSEYAEAKKQFEKFLVLLENSEISSSFMRKLKEEARPYLVELNSTNP